MPDELLETMNDATEKAIDDKDMQKYLTFKSDGLVYGIAIENVIEIITNHTITKLPMVPEYIKGIMNLRGQIIPIVDIKQRMRKICCEKTSDTCIIILEVDSVSIGILVDQVLHVINVEKKLASPPSKNHEFVSGMVNLTDGTIMFCLDCQLLVNAK